MYFWCLTGRLRPLGCDGVAQERSSTQSLLLQRWSLEVQFWYCFWIHMSCRRLHSCCRDSNLDALANPTVTFEGGTVRS